LAEAEQSSTAGYDFLRDFFQDVIAYKTEHFQESTLTIMHFQHDNRYSLVLANFIFLPHILQWQQDKVDRFCFFVVLKSIFLSVAAEPFQTIKLSK
jgi:hypothetical protein